MSWRPGELAAAAGLAALAFALYLRTLAPGLLAGDSGEFQVLAYLLGHTHQTGYPVYILLAKIATWLPVGEIAYRVNLYSAVAAALAVAVTFLAGLALTGRRLPALVGASALAVSTTFWSQAVIAEVYSTALLSLAVVVLMILVWADTGARWTLFVAGTVGGLSLGVHLSVAFFAPAAIAFLALHPRRSLKALKAAVAGSVLGVALMLAAFLIMDRWGSPANIFDATIIPSASSWDPTAEDFDSPCERLVFGLAGTQFQPFMFSDVGRVMPAQGREYFSNLPDELSWVVALAALAGLVRLLRRDRNVAVLLLGGLVIQWAWFFNYEIWDIYVFYLPSYLLVCLVAVAGLNGLESFLAAREVRALIRTGFLVTLVALAVVPGLLRHRQILATGIPRFALDTYPVDELSLTKLHPAARASVRALEPNALVFTNYPWTYAFYYVAYIEEGRTDLTFIETLPRDDRRELADSAIAYVEESLSTRPVFFAKKNWKLDAAGFVLDPVKVGWIRFYRVRRADSP